MVKRRSPSPFDGGFLGFNDDDFFGEFERIRKLMDNMMREGRAVAPNRPLVYGFSMRVGPDGKPHMEKFGNVKEGKVSNEREPLVDVVNLKDEIRVVAELPGVSKNAIRINTQADVLSIEVADSERPFYKDVRLPAPVENKSAKASYKNGILEVVLKKKDAQTKGSIAVT